MELVHACTRRSSHSGSMPVTGMSRSPLYELVGHFVEVAPDVGGLRANVEGRIVFPEDEAGLPTRCKRAQRVPDVASDQAAVAGLHLEVVDDRVVGLLRRLVPAQALSSTLKRRSNTPPMPARSS